MCWDYDLWLTSSGSAEAYYGCSDESDEPEYDKYDENRERLLIEKHGGKTWS